ncbi:MAG: hypothetical protein Ta2D_01740 [Rickettsiales bacterium]|nr:MAG: hypothetical protein Ta2D_01740 [Rickettsiales bacterium]
MQLKKVFFYFILCFSIAKADKVESILNSFIGIPYRNDGATGAFGQYTLFSNQKQVFKNAGFNCSGFVLEAFRSITNEELSLDEVKVDNFNDSGKKAKMGEDWDFGYDLILNITDKFKLKLLLPDATIELDELMSATEIYKYTKTAKPYQSIGFYIQDDKTLEFLKNNIKEQTLYLVDMNANNRVKNYKLSHYHVGIIYRPTAEKIYYYDATRANNVNKRNLYDKKEWQLFKKNFSDSKGNKKKFLLFEVDINKN